MHSIALFFLFEFNAYGLFRTIRKNVFQFILTGCHLAAFRMFSEQMDSVKFTLGGTDTTTYALVLIHHRSTAAQASGSFNLHLFLREAKACVPERLLVIDLPVLARDLTAGGVILFYLDVLLIQLYKVSLVTSNG